MSEFIKNVQIENFKSILHCEMQCKRINLLIGSPNAGKSNVIEALSLFSLPFLGGINAKVTDFVRLQKTEHLFYASDPQHPIIVTTDREKCVVNYQNNGELSIVLESKEGSDSYILDKNLQLKSEGNKKYIPSIRRYTFLAHDSYKKEGNPDYLMPPYGNNLLDVMSSSTRITDEVDEMLRLSQLLLAYDENNQKVQVVQFNYYDKGSFEVPYNCMSDSLKRLIFYKTAIESNHKEVLVFDDPDIHLSMNYVSELITDIIDPVDNQIFLSTNNSHLTSELLDYAGDEIVVFLLDFNDGQSEVKELSNERLIQAYRDRSGMNRNKDKGKWLGDFGLS